MRLPAGWRAAACTKSCRQPMPIAAAASGFGAGLALRAMAAAGPGRDLVWVRQTHTQREAGALYAPGLSAFGLDPARLILVGVRDMVGVFAGGCGGRALPGSRRRHHGALGQPSRARPNRHPAPGAGGGKVGRHGVPDAAGRARGGQCGTDALALSRHARPSRWLPTHLAVPSSTSPCCASAPAPPAWAGAWNGIMSTITSDRPRRYLALWFPFLAVDRLRPRFPLARTG